MPLTNAIRDHICKALIGSAGLTTFSNTNAYLGVGDSAAAFAVTQTDLQAATNKLRKGMDATFPTDPPSPSNRLTFRASYATTDANWVWAEWAVFNASTVGTMLSRVVQALGTKTSAAAWQLTVTIDITV